MEPPDVLGMTQDPGPAPKLPDRKKSKLLMCVTFWVYRMASVQTVVFGVRPCVVM